MKIALSGASGLLGSALVPALRERGDEVARLVRREPRMDQGEVHWDPAAEVLDAAGLEGCQAVVHLAGENIGARRWNPTQKERLVRSRVRGTELIADAVAGMTSPPSVLVCASAVGVYGDRGEEVLNDGAVAGQGFLADLCQQWEAAASSAVEAGIRVVWLRFGVILSARGGALAKMLFPFKMGAGGVMGDGRQYMPWISRPDAVGAVLHALDHDSVRGPVNVVANAVTNREFTKALGRVLSRPTILPMPAFAAKLAFGEMAQELLLAGQRVEPIKLRETGYQFQHAGLDDALRQALSE